VSNISRHITALLLRQRGQNGPLCAELEEKLSPEGKDRLFRILQDMELEVGRAKRRHPWLPGQV
jgi:hypothetical protein